MGKFRDTFTRAPRPGTIAKTRAKVPLAGGGTDLAGTRRAGPKPGAAPKIFRVRRRGESS